MCLGGSSIADSDLWEHNEDCTMHLVVERAVKHFAVFTHNLKSNLGSQCVCYVRTWTAFLNGGLLGQPISWLTQWLCSPSGNALKMDTL